MSTAGRRPIQLDDLLGFRAISDPQPSPDGNRVAYVVTSLDAEGDDTRSTIWILDRKTGASRPLTGGERDLAPRWSPDGTRLAFLSRRSTGEKPGAETKGVQVHVIPVDGGEARPLSRDLEQVSNLRWSPKGDAIAVLAVRLEPEPSTAALHTALHWEHGADGQDEPATRVSRAQPKRGLRVTDRLKYRFDGIGYFDDRRRHLFLLRVGAQAVDPATPEPLTTGLYDVDDFDWHPDGTRIAFITNRADDADFKWRRDIWEVAIGGGDARQLVRSEGAVWGLAWSPDGRYLGYVGNDHRHGHATQNALWLHEDATGAQANVTREFDQAVAGQLFGDVRAFNLNMRPAWSPDARRVYFTAVDRGNAPVFAAHVDGLREAEVQNLLPEWTGGAYDVSAGPDGVWFVADGPTSPPELYELSTTGGATGAPERRTGFNAELTASLDLRPYERVAYHGPDGLPLEGWLCLPPDFDPGKRYPLVLYIHGGPHGAYGNAFHHEKHARAAQGRVVLFTNPRGSTGYGQAFTAACVGDWGGMDYQDIMAGVDAVIARGFVDTGRMAVTGISYGGYMTNWVVTHTDRFAAAITEMCVSNLLSFYGTSDIGTHFLEFEIPGAIWDDPENLWAHSPIRYIDRCVTPTLVIHGEHDWRCPIEQGEQVFACLKRRGVDTAMVRFPDASHVFSLIGKPSQRLGRLRVMDAWLRRYLG